MRKALAAAVVLSLFTLAGCYPFYPLLSIPKTPKQKPLSLPEGKSYKPIALSKVRVKLPRNKIIGTVRYRRPCLSPDKEEFAQARIRWGSGQRRDVTSDDFTDIFREEMRKANFNVLGDPARMFSPSQLPANAELLMGAVIQDIKVNLCRRQSYWDFRILLEERTGEAYVKVKWLLYSALDQKVVFEKNVGGYYSNEEESETNTAFNLYLEAFAASLNNLLADERFMQLAVSRPGASLADKVKSKFYRVDTRGLEANPLPEGLEKARAAVVTVFAGSGHGTGFFISPDGLLLTNYHVAGAVRYATVLMHSGRRVVAEVLAGSPKHDVALLKVGETGLPAFRLNSKEPPVGTEVFAIGSPRLAKMKSTVTRGIVGGYPIVDRERLLQSDVTIYGGNSGGPLLDKSGRVVAITVSALLGSSGEHTGHNFFIPVDTAIRALNLTFPYGR